jgi:hypothetical protein
MAAISLSIGPVTVATTVTPAELTRLMALLQADWNAAPPNAGLPAATPKQAMVYFLQGVLGAVSNRVVAFEAVQAATAPIAPTPIG